MDNSYSRRCNMTMNWSQNKYDSMTPSEREAEQCLILYPKSLDPNPTSQIDHSLTGRVEAESVPSAGDTKGKRWFPGWDVLLAALAGGVTFFVLSIASFGVFVSAVTVAAVAVAIGLGHYLLWGRVFARRVAREGQRFQDQAHRPQTSQTEPPDEFLLALNDRERMELLQLLEHSSAAATQGREGSGSGERLVIRRGLQERIRAFGA
jgi:hypothetical protein